MSFPKSGIQDLRAVCEQDSLTLLFAGDFCPRGNVQQLIADGKSAEIMAPIQDILRSADVSMIQFETPLTNADTPICKCGPNLKCPPESIELLKAWGGHVALLANNHTGDLGRRRSSKPSGFCSKTASAPLVPAKTFMKPESP